MNIMKLQSQLRSPSVTLQDLVGYVQDQQGPVPSYLALAELSRRKKLSAESAQQAPAPTESVASQEMAGVEPEPGIANLPLQDPSMFSEQSMAAGGIVAFGGGGDVPSYAGNSIYGSLVDALSLTPLGSAVPAYKNIMDLAGGEASRQVTSGEAAREIAGVAKKAWESEKDFIKRVALETGLPVSAVAQQAQEAPKADSSLKGPYAPAMDPLAAAEKQKSVLLQNQVAGKYDPVPAASGGIDALLQPKPGPAPAPAPAPFDAVPNVPFKPMDAPDAKFKDLLRTEITPQQGMEEFKNIVGENEGLAGLKTRLTGMEDKAAREEEQAPWMALTRAGLAMAAGKSQNALQNIAEGAGVGLSDYTAAKERLANKEEKRFAIQTQLAQAERAEQIAAATHGYNSAERIKASNDATKLAQTQASLNVDIANAKNKIDVEGANIKNELDYRQQQDTRDYQQGVLSNQKEANKIAKENKALGLDLKTAQLYKDLENQARMEVKDRVSATQAQLTDPQYDKMIQDTYLALLRKNNLTPLAGPIGWSYEGPASGKK